MEETGRFLIILGALFVVVGIVLTFAKHMPFLGKLPGDIFYQKGSMRIYFPIVTSISLSVILSLLLRLAVRR